MACGAAAIAAALKRGCCPLKELDLDGNLLPDPPMDAESVQDELRWYAPLIRLGVLGIYIYSPK